MVRLGVPGQNNNFLAYVDQRLAIIPAVQAPRRPTVNDKKGYPLFCEWRTTKESQAPVEEGEFWKLVRFESNGDATWIQFVVAGTNAVITVETDDGVVFVEPDGAGNLQILGGTGIAVTGNGGPGNTVTVTNTGGTGGLETLTADDTNQATAAAQNIDILGGPGITTTASGDTLTINSVVYSDISGAIGALSDNGYFCTAATTLTLPASPLQGEIVEVVCDSAGPIVVTANAGQFIRNNQVITAAAGTATNSAIGDVLIMRYRDATTTWHVTSSIGLWGLV